MLSVCLLAKCLTFGHAQIVKVAFIKLIGNSKSSFYKTIASISKLFHSLTQNPYKRLTYSSVQFVLRTFIGLKSHGFILILVRLRTVRTLSLFMKIDTKQVFLFHNENNKQINRSGATQRRNGKFSHFCDHNINICTSIVLVYIRSFILIFAHLVFTFTYVFCFFSSRHLWFT